MNNDIMQISHQNLKTGTLIKIIIQKIKKLFLKILKELNIQIFIKF